MLCLTLSAVNQQLGKTGGNAYIPNDAYAIAYVQRSQPAECAADQYVLVTKSDLAVFSPFQMDLQSAVAIGGATLLTMAVAFVFRMATNALKSTGKDTE